MMDEQEQYERVCKPAFMRIEKMLKEIHCAMFKDNGGECWQSKLNRHDRWIGFLKWFALTIGSVLTVVIATLVIKAITS